jgi:hypothetical protein
VFPPEIPIQIEACPHALKVTTGVRSLIRRLALVGWLALVGSRSWIGLLPWIAIVPFPLIAFTEDGDGRDAVVPVLVRIFGNSKVVKVEHVVIDQSADAAEVTVIEDAQARSTKYANGTNSVVESRRHGGPALTILEAEGIPPET